MKRYLLPLTAYFLAFLAASCLAWGLFSLQAQLLFDPQRGQLAPVLFYAIPLAGLALFQLIFGGIEGKWRGWMFWLIAVPAVYTPFLIALSALFRGYISPPEAAGPVLAVPFIIGLVAFFLTRDRD